MRSRTPKLIVAVLALFAGVLLCAAPAQANPDWELFDTTNGRKVAIGDTLTADIGSGGLRFSALFNGFPWQLDCQPSAGFGLLSHDMASGDQFAASPGTWFWIPMTPKTTISTSASGPEQGNCQNAPFGGDADVTTSGTDWMFEFTAPPVPGSPGIFVGTTPATLTVPAGAISIWDSSTGCGVTLPNVATALTGTHDGGTGLLTLDPHQPMTATWDPGCFVINTELDFGSLQFDPRLSVIY